MRDLADFADVSIRGTGESRFLYAKSLCAAIEISSSNSGVWVEYWNNTDEASVKDEILYDRRIVLQRARNWLSRGAA